MKSKISKALKYQLWSLMTWLGILKSDKIKIAGVECSDTSNELCLTNDACGFMYNFEIDDLKSIKYLNTVMCLWANQGIKTTKDCNGISIFDNDKNLTYE